MLHARDDLLADEAAFVEIDAVQMVEQRLVRKGIAESIVLAAFRHAEGDAEGVVVLLARGLATEFGGTCALRQERTVAERGQPRIRIDDGATRLRRLAAPTGRDLARRIGADLDRCAEPVEREPFQKLFFLLARQIGEEAVPLGHEEEIEQDLTLRREEAGMDGIGPLHLADIARDQALQEFTGVGAPDPEDGAGGQ